MWDPSSLTKDWTHFPCTEGEVSNTRPPRKSHNRFFSCCFLLLFCFFWVIFCISAFGSSIRLLWYKAAGDFASSFPSASTKSHGWRSLVGYSPRGRKESDMTEHSTAALPLVALGSACSPSRWANFSHHERVPFEYLNDVSQWIFQWETIRHTPPAPQHTHTLYPLTVPSLVSLAAPYSALVGFHRALPEVGSLFLKHVTYSQGFELPSVYALMTQSCQIFLLSVWI